MQRVVAARGEPAIDLDQVAHIGHLRRDDDAIVAEPDLLGERRAERSALASIASM